MARTRPQVGYPAAKKRMTPRRTTSRAGMVAGGKQVDLESLATSTKKPKQGQNLNPHKINCFQSNKNNTDS